MKKRQPAAGKRFSRRALLGGTMAAGLVAPRLVGALAVGESAGPAGPLSADLIEPLAAAADRVLPGVVAAGFVDYTNYWLSRPPLDRAADWRPLLKAGAVLLDRLARQRHDSVFSACSPGQQDAILREFQQGKVASRRFQGQVFFQRLVMLSMESFLSDPRYGGNRNGVGFSFIGRRHQCWWAPRRLEVEGEKGRLGEHDKTDR